MKILKVAPGVDSENLLGRILGPAFEVAAFDPSRPLIEQVADAEVLILRDVPVPSAVIDAAPRLKLLQRYGQHLVGVDVAHATTKGVFVARIPPAVTGGNRAVAEHAMFLILALAKRYRACARAVAERRLGVPRTLLVHGKTLGLIGVGHTGRPLVPLAKAFGMTVIAATRTASAPVRDELGLDSLVEMSRSDEVIGGSDFVSIHLPLAAATTNWFDGRRFGLMTPGAFLINIARGPIVDQDALVAALASGRLGGAGLDVFADEPIDPAHPLLRFDNVIATPHVAAPTVETEERLAHAVAENIRRVGRGLAPLYSVGADEEQGPRGRSGEPA